MALPVPPHIVQPDRVVISGVAKYNCEVLASHLAADCVFVSATAGLPPEAQALAKRKATTISLPAGNRAIGAGVFVSMPVTVVRWPNRPSEHPLPGLPLPNLNQVGGGKPVSGP